MNAYQLLLKELLGSNNVRYFPSLARRVGGAKTALLLSQLLYWHAKYPDGFYVGVDDMTDQTGLTDEEQRTGRKKLKSLGVVAMELKGIPRRWHYKPDLEKLASLMGFPHQRSLEKPTDEDRESTPILDGEPHQLNKEQEIKKEIKKKVLIDDILNNKLDQVKGHLVALTEPASFAVFIEPLLPLSQENNTLTLIVKDKHHQDWLETRVITKQGYLNIFKSAFNDFNLQIKTVLVDDL